jgi:RimJ/RimL family protein N-acetyltransferase
MPPDDWIIRPATFADASAVAVLASSAEDVRQAAPSDVYPLQTQDVLRWLGREGRSGYVLEDRGEILAYGELNPEPQASRAYWIGHLIVRTDVRAQGIGKRMVASLTRHGFALLRARSVRIAAFEDNPVALACYRACGFHENWRQEVGGRMLVDMGQRSRRLGRTGERLKRWLLPAPGWSAARQVAMATLYGSLLGLAYGELAGRVVAGFALGAVVAAALTLLYVLAMRTAASVRRAAGRP